MNENQKDDQGPDKAVETKQPVQVRGQSRNALFGIILIITLALAAGGLYLAYRNRDAGLSTRTTVEGLLGSREKVSTRIKDLEMQLDQLRVQQEVTARSVQDLARELPGNNEDWALREVEFLLIIATHHLALEHNIDAALGAMQEAALRLRGLDGAALDPVREQLTGDIKRLQDQHSADASRLALSLEELAGRINKLPLAGGHKETGKTVDNLQSQTAGDKGILDALWEELRNFVIIRHEDDKQRAVLAPGQEYYLYQNLRLELESARLSLLRRDTENLHASVATLQTWLAEYFDKDDPAVADALKTMKQLSSINLTPPVPDISSSLESLRAYMRDKDETTPMDGDSGGPGT
jgi:uroporphyrin-3 C-methyltransferase